MTGSRVGRVEGLPEAIEAVPPVSVSGGGLAIAGPADEHGFLIEGDRVRGWGPSRGPFQRLLFDGRPVGDAWHCPLGTVATVVRYPGVLRREWVGRAGVTVETIVVHPTLPLLAIQWDAPGGGERELLGITLGDDAPELGADARIAASAPRSDGAPRTTLTITPGGRLAFDGAGRVTVTGSGATTLLVTAVPRERVASVLAAGRHLPAHLRRAVAAEHEDGLRLRSGVADLDDAIEWARWRLRGSVSHAGDDASEDPHGMLLTGLAGIATGDRATAQGALARLPSGQPALRGVLAARLSMGFGVVGPAVAAAERLIAESATGQDGERMDALARRLLGSALHGAVPSEMLDRLTPSPITISSRTAGRALPVVGSQAADEWPGWLESLLEGTPGAPPKGEGSTIPDFVDDPDRAWQAWRGAVDRGMGGGPAGPGSWDAPAVAGAPGAAAVLLGLTQGVLGFSPDAGKGRITLRPRIPVHVRRFAVEALTVGDSRIDFRYQRDGPLHTFHLGPRVSAVPALAVVHASVPGRVGRVTVDGSPATLDVRVSGARSVVPVQLPVDGVRRLDIETEE